LPLDKVLIHGPTDTKLSEMVLPEEQVLEKLNAVSTAKRLANMVRFVPILQINFLRGRTHPLVTKLRGLVVWRNVILRHHISSPASSSNIEY